MKAVKKFLCFIIVVLLHMQLSAMTTQGDRILNSSGQEIQLKGVNWFGFNNGDTMVDGLWSSDPLAGDFATVVYRMQLLGFNAVRLPFSFVDLYHLSPRNYVQSCQMPSPSSVQASVTNPNVPVTGKIPPMTSPPDRVPGSCDNYFPNDTTLNRFLWTVNFFAKNGFYVLIDNHREDPTVLQDPQQWVHLWTDLVTRISQDPLSKSMLMVDILNEPDGFGIHWEASGGKPALKDLYISVMDAIYPINQQALFFVEGTGQGGIDANWGDGFATDPALISQYGLSDPRPFFNAILIKPYLNQIVISPHVYPPSVTGAGSNYSGSGLYNRLSNSFGYLTQHGYCNNSCKTFPVAIGEFGSRFATSTDITSMHDIAQYLNNSGAAADGKHHAIKHWFYWAWNPNSGDTGGLMQDNWLDIIWQKIDYLADLALTPWYAKPTTPVKTGTLCLTIVPVTGLSKSDLKPISVGNQTYAFDDFNLTICHTLPVGSYTVTAPQITTPAYIFSANPQNITITEGSSTPVFIVYVGTPVVTPPPPTGAFVVTVQPGSAWQEDPTSGIYFNVINLYVRNNSKSNVGVPWKITLTNSAYQQITGFWNLTIDSVQNGQIKGTVRESWEALPPNGANVVNLGMIVSSTSPNFIPTSISVNGVAATIVVKP